MLKPMLAYTIDDTSKLTFPQLVSPKLDGIRCTIQDGVAYSRSNKPIRSKLVQEKFGNHIYNGLDGELIYGDATAENVFNLSTQAVMSTELPEGFNPDELRFHVFDSCLSQHDALDRFNLVQVSCHGMVGLVAVKQQMIVNAEELLELENRVVNQGYEGLMCKSPYGLYKNGRSTANGGEIGKLKRFADAEALIVGFEEKMHNTNEAKTNELGRSQRSQAKEGLVGAGTLGSLQVRSEEWGEFNIGSGFNDAQRQEIWDNRGDYLGKLVKFKYFPIGCKDTVRFPIYLGIRDEIDL